MFVDDITHPDEEPQNCTPNEISHETIPVTNRLDKWQELQPLPGIAEHSLAKDASDETLTYSGWQVSEELIQGIHILCLDLCFILDLIRSIFSRSFIYMHILLVNLFGFEFIIMLYHSFTCTSCLCVNPLYLMIFTKVQCV